MAPNISRTSTCNLARGLYALLVILMVVWLAGCDAGDTRPIPAGRWPTPIPATSDTLGKVTPDTPIPTLVLLTPALEATIARGTFASGGLGLTRQEWEQRYGPPSHTDDNFSSEYANNEYGISYWGANPQYVLAIFRRYQSESGTIQQAQAEAHAMLPSDATFIRNKTSGPCCYRPDETIMIEYYNSQSLLGQFPRWGGSPFNWSQVSPGDFVIEYSLDQKGLLFNWQIVAGAAE